MSGDINAEGLGTHVEAAFDCTIALKEEAVAYQDSTEYRLLCNICEQLKDIRARIVILKEVRKRR